MGSIVGVGFQQQPGRSCQLRLALAGEGGLFALDPMRKPMGEQRAQLSGFLHLFLRRPHPLFPDRTGFLTLFHQGRKARVWGGRERERERERERGKAPTYAKKARTLESSSSPRSVAQWRLSRARPIGVVCRARGATDTGKGAFLSAGQYSHGLSVAASLASERRTFVNIWLLLSLPFSTSSLQNIRVKVHIQ